MHHPAPTAASRSAEAGSGFRNALKQLSERKNPVGLSAWLRGHLFEHVLPFWERHAVDADGGLFTCIGDDGKILDTNKWLWSQWRAVWVFSKVFNTLERRDIWLRLAKSTADFCLAHGWIEQDRGWALLLDQSGAVLRGCESTYVDAFAVYGLAELYRATGSATYRQWAVRTADAALEKLAGPRDRIPHFPYPIPQGAKPQGIPMLWSLVLAELGNALDEKKYLEAAHRLSEEIFRDHFDPEADCVREFVSMERGIFDAPEGRVVVPGHVIENMWFQMRVTELGGNSSVCDALARRLILRHLELGWDKKNGGLLLAVASDGSKPVAWGFAESKLWWPLTEALIATLWAWIESGEEAFFQWYETVWQLCLRHYVDWEHGEWKQKLDRNFFPLHDTVALPVKDPFHLPRSLILQIEMLEGIHRSAARNAT